MSFKDATSVRVNIAAKKRRKVTEKSVLRLGETPKQPLMYSETVLSVVRPP